MAQCQRDAFVTPSPAHHANRRIVRTVACARRVKPRLTVIYRSYGLYHWRRPGRGCRAKLTSWPVPAAGLVASCSSCFASALYASADCIAGDCFVFDAVVSYGIVIANQGAIDTVRRWRSGAPQGTLGRESTFVVWKGERERYTCSRVISCRGLTVFMRAIFATYYHCSSEFIFM